MKPEMGATTPTIRAIIRFGLRTASEPIEATTAEQAGGDREQAHQGDQGGAAETLPRLIGLEHLEADQQGRRQQAGDLRGEPAGDEQHHRPDEHHERDQTVLRGGDREERLHRDVQR